MVAKQGHISGQYECAGTVVPETPTYYGSGRLRRPMTVRDVDSRTCGSSSAKGLQAVEATQARRQGGPCYIHPKFPAS